MSIKTKQITVYLDDAGGEHATLELAARANAERKLYEILDDRAAYSEIGVGTAVEIIMKHWADLCEIMREAQAPVIEVLQDEVDTVQARRLQGAIGGPWTQARDELARKKGVRAASKGSPPAVVHDESCECGECWQKMEAGGGESMTEEQFEALEAWITAAARAAAFRTEHYEETAQYAREHARKLLMGATCRECGCTDDDCSGCIERTGEPCSWVEPDLCSACVGEPDKGPKA